MSDAFDLENYIVERRTAVDHLHRHDRPAVDHHHRHDRQHRPGPRLERSRQQLDDRPARAELRRHVDAIA